MLSREERRLLFDARFRLIEQIGSGGSGVVWRAVDTDTDTQVAIKRVFVYSTGHRARVRREIAALRLLQIPGVVRLVDVGEVDAEPYIAMELLQGGSFPGTAAAGDWRAVARSTIQLCGTVERVHTLGVVHRDLKPANVFVEPDGRVVLLDFGLARGEQLAETVTEHGGVVGTIGYLAPEQLCGGVPDFRSDLYALGVMLYEALGGRRSKDELAAFRAMLRGEAVPLVRAPLEGVPEELNALATHLMQPDPERRPKSAREVAERLAALLGETLAPEVPIPLLGRERFLAHALARLREGKSIVYWGAAGTGKTRVLDELQLRLEAECLPVARLIPGARPFEALLPWIGLLPEGPGGLGVASERLRARLEACLCVLVDDLDTHDSWTRRVIERCAGFGSMAVVARRPEAEVLPPLSVEDLRPLFRGPDAFLHLIEDGARLLHLRTSGVPKQVAREVRTWLAVGRAEWDTAGARPLLAISRSQLDELEAWPGLVVHGLGGAVNLKLEAPLAEVLAWIVVSGPIGVNPLTEAMAIPAWELDLELEELEVLGHLYRRGDERVEARVVPAYLDTLSEERIATMHRRFARARRDEPEERMRHWLACGDVELAVEAAQEAAEAQFAAARHGRAKGLYAAAIRAARGANRSDIEERALVGYVETALSEISAAGADEAQRYAERRSDELGERLSRLARAVGAAARGRWMDAAVGAQGLGPLPSEGLEAVRLAALVRCANLGQTQDVEELLTELEPACTRTAAARSRFLSWRGLAAYAAGRYVEAVEFHEASLACAPNPFRRVVATTNLCVALLEVFAVDRARGLAVELELLSAKLRLPYFERWGRLMAAVCSYRVGDAVELSEDTLLGSSVVGRDVSHANLCLTAAAAAWRVGDLGVALRFGRESGAAARAVNRPEAAALSDALLVACGDESTDIAALMVTSRRLPPRVLGQVLALVSAAGPVPEELAASAMDAGDGPEGIRLEVLDWREVLAYLRRPSGAPDVRAVQPPGL